MLQIVVSSTLHFTTRFLLYEPNLDEVLPKVGILCLNGCIMEMEGYGQLCFLLPQAYVSLEGCT